MTAYEKINKCIKSCKTQIQLDACQNIIVNFSKFSTTNRTEIIELQGLLDTQREIIHMNNVHKILNNKK